MHLLLLTPPSTQLNTPYPATAFLARYLREHGLVAGQRDLGIELVSRLLTPEGLGEVFDAVAERAASKGVPEEGWRALAARDRWVRAATPVVRLLRDGDRTVVPLILGSHLLPPSPRVRAADRGRFGRDAVDDTARHLATLFVADVADLVAACVDEGFALAGYQHHLAVGPVGFGPIAGRLRRTSPIDQWLDEMVDALPFPEGAPPLVGITVPFPGTLVGALRMGRRLRERGAFVALGGGYVNTELRATAEPRLWEYADALVFDEGGPPLVALLEHLRGGPDRRHRTRTLAGDHDMGAPSTGFVPAAWYGDLPRDRYLQVVDATNPAHRLWSDGRWNKIALAHGCYWRRCAFCDVSLDYVARFVPAEAEALVDLVDELVRDTGTTGFHFVDEAAPPRVMRDFALELLRRGRAISWWGNIRFEKAFTPDLCRLLGAAGLVAVTGGLETASDRLLALMEKGVTIAQAARACRAFREAGVLVHAYLMYGFPTETAAETVGAAEVVRQMFAAGLLDSAFWHRFVLTRHSPVFAHPERFGVVPGPGGAFAGNDVPHEDPAGADPAPFDGPLARALAAWMAGEGLDRPVFTWFDAPMPPASVAPDLIARACALAPADLRPADRLVWIGADPIEARGALLLPHDRGEERVSGSARERAWLLRLVDAARPASGEVIRYGVAVAGYPGDWTRMERRWELVRRAGMVGV